VACGGRALRGVAAVAGLALAGLGPAGTAAAAEVEVAATNFTFDPPKLDVLVGDVVEWNNVSIRTHTVTADDGVSFDSGQFGSGESFSHTFAAVGAFPYHCELHPSITGSVRVEEVLLSGPAAPVDAGSTVTLRGRAEEGASSVTIERDEGTGFSPIAAVPVGPGGEFELRVTVARTARYRAEVGNARSSPLEVVAFERPQVEVAINSRQRDRTILHVRVVPKRPRGVVVVQLRLRERFGWWPVARDRLNLRSRGRFRLPPTRAKARVVLTLNDGATILAASEPVRLR
jgi:plastocyanin